MSNPNVAYAIEEYGTRLVSGELAWSDKKQAVLILNGPSGPCARVFSTANWSLSSRELSLKLLRQKQNNLRVLQNEVIELIEALQPKEATDGQ